MAVFAYAIVCTARDIGRLVIGLARGVRYRVDGVARRRGDGSVSAARDVADGFACVAQHSRLLTGPLLAARVAAALLLRPQIVAISEARPAVPAEPAPPGAAPAHAVVYQPGGAEPDQRVRPRIGRDRPA